jgi:hypothetical protein
MNVDAILHAFVNRGVAFILIGGMNFLLRHQPVLTFDVDLWVADTEDNLACVAVSLRDLSAQWGRDDQSWGPVPDGSAWLRLQGVYCLTSAYGPIDIFREVRGLEGQWTAYRARCTEAKTPSGIPFASLSERDMLACRSPGRRRTAHRTRALFGATPAMTPEEKREEEAKRDRNYDPVERWKQIQAAITWAEANLPTHLRRNRPRTHKSLQAS